MTFDEAKKELESYRKLRLYIATQEERIELLETVIQHGSTDIVKIEGRGGAGIMEKLAKLADLKAKRDELLAKLYEREARIEESVGSLQDIAYSVLLELYYLNGKTIEQVCVEMSYSYRQTIRLKNKAIESYRIMRSCF